MTLDRRRLLLDLLRNSAEPRSILSLAEDLDVHANTVRFHLDALVRAGQVEQLLGDTSGPGRPPVLFRATHRMDPAGPTNYQLLAAMLTDHLATGSADPAATATELGRAWGPHVIGASADGTAPAVKRGAALARMTDVLTDLGFAPESPGPRASTIRLRHCPFLGLVTDQEARSSVICSLHLGLMQGGLEALHAPVTVDRLDPFVEPDLCVAHVVSAPSSGRSS